LFSCANFWILLSSLSALSPFPLFQFLDIFKSTPEALCLRLCVLKNDTIVLRGFQEDRIFNLKGILNERF
jgi:hypothetical protein